MNRNIVREKPKARVGTFLFLDLARRTKCETLRQKYLLLYYASRADREGRFSVGNKRIERETGFGKSTIDRANADFKAAGILTWIRGYGNRHNKEVDGTPNAFSFIRRTFEKLPPVTISKPQPKSTQTLLEDVV